LLETKLDDTDDIWVNNFAEQLGYCAFINNRKTLSVRRSGGIVVLVKNSIKKYIKSHRETCEIVQWLLIDKKLFNYDKDVLIGGFYIPPEQSIYGGTHLFDCLDEEILFFTRDRDCHVCIMGDFNAHTKNMPDYFELDDIIINEFNLGDIFAETRNAIELLETNAILDRTSKDQHVNNYGYRMVDFCGSHSLFIANGRIGDDRNLGEFTCVQGTTNHHVIDYCIATYELLLMFDNFKILYFDPLYSDVHCPIEVYLSVSTNDSREARNNINVQDMHNPRVKIKWDKSKINEFTEKLANAGINEIKRDLACDQINVNIANQKLCDVIKCTASTVMGSMHSQRRSNKRPKIASYDTQCRRERRLYRRARRQFKSTESGADKLAMNRASRVYKKAIKTANKKETQKFNNTLKSLKKSNPREYWKFFQKDKRSNCAASLADLYEHFRKLNDEPNYGYNIDFMDVNDNRPDIGNGALNRYFTEEEIRKSIKKLRNFKSSGLDDITNEFLKSAEDVLLPVLMVMFNKVLESGQIPEAWALGNIIPIFKNKGSNTDPSNYRGITLLSCMGKLFTSLLNTRLTAFLEENQLLNINQAGFRKKHSIIDHIFTLKSIVDILLSKKQKLYCAFIDYKMAFDLIWRQALWHKLITTGITGKLLTVIFNMYNNIKSCITVEGQSSNFFNSYIGLRQGENLSPVLFSIFVNDLESFMLDAGCNPVETELDTGNNNEVWLKLLVMLYADDTLILSETPEGLQRALNILVDYCDRWKLVVNRDKTKIVIFQKRKSRRIPEFSMYGQQLEVVDDFRYLGVTFNYNASFNKCRDMLSKNATKAMFFVLKKIREMSLDIDTGFQLFDSMVKPILLFSCEVWGYENISVLEKVHLKFCKYMLGLNRSTPNIMVYGETGRFPLYLEISKRMVKYWCKLASGHETMSQKMYKTLYGMHMLLGSTNKWLAFVKSTIEGCGMAENWMRPQNNNINCFPDLLHSRLKDQFIQQWYTDVWNSPKALTYRHIKDTFQHENYLIKLPSSMRITLCRFRCSNHKLQIEVGRHTRTPREERLCNKCNTGQLGDEFHLLLTCPYYNNLRILYIPQYYYINPTLEKLTGLFNASVPITRKLCKFITKANIR